MHQDLEEITKINPLGTIGGFIIGIGTRMMLGEQAYQTPGGALGAGVFMARSPVGVSGKLSQVVLSIANCEIGYYAGVIATEYALNYFK